MPTRSSAQRREHLLGRWTRQKQGSDAQGACRVDIALEFRADGRFTFRRTFRASDHSHPTPYALANSGTWVIERGALVQHWDGHGERPLGWTTRWPLLRLSPSCLRYVEGVDGTVTYRRPASPTRLLRKAYWTATVYPMAAFVLAQRRRSACIR